MEVEQGVQRFPAGAGGIRRRLPDMTNPSLEFGPGQPVQKYSAQLPAGQATFELKNPAEDADAIVALYDSAGGKVFADITVTPETVRIEVDPVQGIGIVARVVLVG
jgi:hypothetical protein